LHGRLALRDRGDAEEVSHMLFGDGTGLSGLFATHPPLLQRIQALEPSFDAGQLDSLSRRWMERAPHGLEEDRALGLDMHAGSLSPAGTSLLLEPSVVSAQVAHPEADDYHRADAIVAAIPDVLHAQAVSRESAMPLLLALLLDGEQAVRSLQVEEIAARLGAELANRARHLCDDTLDGLHPQLRLPLAELAFPALRRRPRPQLDAFLDTAHAVVHADGRIALFEYCLGRLLRVQVREALDPAAHARFGRRRLSQVRSELATLLCIVAQHGHGDSAGAQRAYLAGMQRILPQDHLPYLARQPWTLALDGVWEPLDALDPLAKQVLVEAVTATVSHDGRVSVAESELLRTICGVLHCPLPPMLERA
jgi:hypothetical protein